MSGRTLRHYVAILPHCSWVRILVLTALTGVFGFLSHSQNMHDSFIEDSKLSIGVNVSMYGVICCYFIFYGGGGVASDQSGVYRLLLLCWISAISSRGLAFGITLNTHLFFGFFRLSMRPLPAFKLSNYCFKILLLVCSCGSF